MFPDRKCSDPAAEPDTCCTMRKCYRSRAAAPMSIQRPPMQDRSRKPAEALLDVIFALAEESSFRPGDRIRILSRSPPGHYRMPFYLRGKRGTVEAMIESAAVDNEEEGDERNAGSKLRDYRTAIPMTEIWPDYVGSPRDGLRVEIFETWLARI